MPIIEMLVGLKVPDTTAITALRTLHKIGLKNIKNIAKEDYYKFEIDGGIEKFKKLILKTDIIINANKNYFKFDKKNAPSEKAHFFPVKILVKNIDNGSELLKTLNTRLGFRNVKSVEKGILWNLEVEGDAKETARKAAEQLLVNEHYQTYEII